MNLNPENLAVLRVSSETLSNHLRAAATIYKRDADFSRNEARRHEAGSAAFIGHWRIGDQFDSQARDCIAWAAAITNDSILVTD